MIKELTTGLQHIGIPALNLDASIQFYESIGFELVHRKDIIHNETPVKAAFVSLHALVIELYELRGEDLREIEGRNDGYIDHFAINTTDVMTLHQFFMSNNYEVLDSEIQFIDFFDQGVKFFRIKGPNREVIEFNQKM